MKNPSVFNIATSLKHLLEVGQVYTFRPPLVYNSTPPVTKFDDLRLINVNDKNRGIGGKTREIILRYDPVKVMEVGG
jgi:hypothetical protein